jgi:hypothetical protein
MADQSPDPSKTKKETEKKQPETILLTAEELRNIAGGSSVNQPPPKVPPTTG